MEALAVFAATAVVAGIWALYVKYIQQDLAFRASCMDVLLTMLSGYIAITYVGNPWMLLPTGAGAFVGTWATMRWARPMGDMVTKLGAMRASA